VPLSQANIVSQLDTAAEVKIIGGDDRVLLPLPLHHVYPFVIGMLVHSLLVCHWFCHFHSADSNCCAHYVRGK